MILPIKKTVTPLWLLIFGLLWLKSIFVNFSVYGADPAILPSGLLALAAVSVVLAPAFLFRDRSRHIVLLTVHSVISILFFADVIYSRGFGHLVSLHMIIASAGVAGDLSGSVLSLLHPADLLLLADLPVLWYLCFRVYRHRQADRRVRRFVLFLLAGSLVLGGWTAYAYSSGRMENYKKYPLVLSPLGDHFHDVGRFVHEAVWQPSPEDAARIEAWHDANRQYMAADGRYADLAGIFRGRNLIVVQVESLESVILGLTRGEAVTPNLNRLLDSSLYFDQVVEQVRDGNSSDAELLFQASLYPVSGGSAFLRFGSNRWNAIPAILDRYGYTSIALHGDDKDYWNRDTVFAGMGFDRYIGEDRFDEDLLNAGPQVGMGILDQALFQQALREIRKLPEPFHAFLITITSHMPFTMPEEFLGMDLAPGDETNDYLQSIHYLDETFGAFYRGLEAEGLLEDSILVIYGDHEGVHKYYPTDLPANDHRVPFLIHAPGLEGRVISNPGGQVDMMPTLMYLMGVDPSLYDATAMGRNLLGPVSGSSILPTGEILGAADDVPHLKAALSVSDLAIRSDHHRKRLDRQDP